MLFAIRRLLNLDDQDFISNLYCTYYHLLGKEVNRILQNSELKGDVVTSAVLSLFSRVAFLRTLEEKDLIAYLRATVRNAAYKQYNAQKQRNLSEFVPCDSLLFSLPGPVQDDPANITIKNEEYRMVREAIATLPEADRQALYLKYAAELTSREIAEITNAPSENAVNIRLSRARHKVLRLLEDWGWGRE